MIGNMNNHSCVLEKCKLGENVIQSVTENRNNKHSQQIKMTYLKVLVKPI